MTTTRDPSRPMSRSHSLTGSPAPFHWGRRPPMGTSSRGPSLETEGGTLGWRSVLRKRTATSSASPSTVTSASLRVGLASSGVCTARLSSGAGPLGFLGSALDSCRSLASGRRGSRSRGSVSRGSKSWSSEGNHASSV